MYTLNTSPSPVRTAYACALAINVCVSHNIRLYEVRAYYQNNNFADSSIVWVKNIMVSSCRWWHFLTATSAIDAPRSIEMGEVNATIPLMCLTLMTKGLQSRSQRERERESCHLWDWYNLHRKTLQCMHYSGSSDCYGDLSQRILITLPLREGFHIFRL